MRSMLSEAKSRRCGRCGGTTLTATQSGFEVLMEATKYCSLGQLTAAMFEVGGQNMRSMCAAHLTRACVRFSHTSQPRLASGFWSRGKTC